MTGRRSFPGPLAHTLAVVVLSAALLACSNKATPTPPPQPTPLPSATPSAEKVLADSTYTITFNDELIGVETLHVDHADQQLLVISELKRYGGPLTGERRTIVLDAGLAPARYDLEASAGRARSTWVAEIHAEGVDCLNNNLAWIAPVLVVGVKPAPQVLLESSPSALPFALLALRYNQPGEKGQPTERMNLQSLDLLEDYPATRALTVTVAPGLKGEVIGTLALEGQMAGGTNPRFTLWIRPANRLLYSVEIPDYRFSLWQGLDDPRLAKPGKLVIQRVSRLPDAPTAPPAQGTHQTVEFTGSDKTRRVGTLLLPAGSGPFPCLVLHSAGGLQGRWDAGNAFAAQGWAVYGYDRRGLGESEGDFDRGPVKALAADAVEAGKMLAARQEIDPQRIVFLGLGQGGVVGALVASDTGPYAAVVLGSCVLDGPLFPALAGGYIEGQLAPFYQWSASETKAYQGVSVDTWQKWLESGEEEVALLRRRASLHALQDLAASNMPQALSQARVPVLLLQGEADAVVPVEGAKALVAGLQGGAAHGVTLATFPGLGADLGQGTGKGALDAAVQQALFDWLGKVLAP